MTSPIRALRKRCSTAYGFAGSAALSSTCPRPTRRRSAVAADRFKGRRPGTLPCRGQPATECTWSHAQDRRLMDASIVAATHNPPPRKAGMGAPDPREPDADWTNKNGKFFRFTHCMLASTRARARFTTRPKVDVDKLVKNHQKNIDALGRSAQVATEGVQSLASKQREIVEAAFTEVSAMARDFRPMGNPQERIVKQAEFAKKPSTSPCRTRAISLI
jgi:hypothetical protein